MMRRATGSMRIVSQSGSRMVMAFKVAGPGKGSIPALRRVRPGGPHCFTDSSRELLEVLAEHSGEPCGRGIVLRGITPCRARIQNVVRHIRYRVRNMQPEYRIGTRRHVVELAAD